MIEQGVVERLVDEFLSEHEDIYLVDVSIKPGNKIVVELGADAGIGLDECVTLSKYIENGLDRETEDFELEVGSAGITSPMKVLRQYQSAIEAEVEVLRKGGVKEKGILKSASSDCIELEVARRIKVEGSKRKQDIEEVISIPMEEVLQCKRIIKF